MYTRFSSEMVFSYTERLAPPIYNLVLFKF